MITEDYVSFETAKLLKENGFDDVCSAIWRYWEDGIGEPYFIASLSYECGYTYCYNSGLKKSESDGEIDIACPTLQMAMKWLRKTKDIQVVIGILNTIKKTWTFALFRDFDELTQKFYSFKTYEEACETAIKYCLENLI